MILVMMFPFSSATTALTDASQTLVDEPPVAHWMSELPVKHLNARKIRVFLRSGDRRQQKALACGGKSVGLPSDVAAQKR